MEKIQKTINTKKFKHIIFCAAVIIVIGWVIFRFAAVASENARYVFNASRVAADVGAPVQVVEISQTDGVLYEPIAVRNNRAYVAGANVNKFKAGQKVGEGKIASVSSDLDLDTGMFVVRTRGVSDGLHFAEFTARGHFVPVYAVNNDTVMVVRDGVADARSVTVSRQDSNNAYITSGLNDGDIVILSKVDSGTKVQIKK